MRDIESYSNKYLVQDFEPYQVNYRRKKVLERLDKYKPHRILEIGCGLEPIGMYYKKYELYTIIEPSEVFVQKANELFQERKDTRIIRGFFETSNLSVDDKYDFIIVSSLLHEVEDPVLMLKKIAAICNSDTVVHINVPNADSFHRLVAKEMGLIATTQELSENNKLFQQHNVFNLVSLKELISDSIIEYGKVMHVIEEGSYFVKPFTHKQMEQLLNTGIINELVLDGLYKMTKYMPSLGSEIYVDFKID